ncbi:MAG TPA: redoxin domain-containing protein [Solirubrobacteraceae bacterium]|nr:redoxin domain-containing protein [Solirubrobacteraceae bacterium]
MTGERHERHSRRRPGIGVALAAALAGLLLVAVVISATSGSGGRAVSAQPANGLAANPELDPGTPLDRQAPPFTLTDQFGHRVSLSDYRGRVVLLAFNDSQCTTVCPLTTTAMLDARRFLGAAGREVALLGIDANPQATSVADVRSYSRAHGMLYQWRFLTAPASTLRRVWQRYGIAVEIAHGLIDHTPALYVIDQRGRERMIYQTQMSYASVPQLGQLLAHEVSRLLPGHPQVHSSLAYSQIPGIAPSTPVQVPSASGPALRLGPGRARLLLFFDTWDSEVLPGLARQLDGLNAYARAAGRGGLPALVAVDEASVEPSPSALGAFLDALPSPLAYPVAIDRTGRLADGYEVQDEPWLVLVSATGRIAWYYDVSTQGWLGERALVAQVRAALARVPQVKVPSAAAAAAALAGSPAPLATLHAQASELLGSQSALQARLRALRGYPVVINAWASWCDPCQAEYPLFASASERYGREVAFLGADTDDQAPAAQAFLEKHPVSYPSYQDSSSQLASLAPLEGLPTTIFIDRRGRVVHVHTGQYLTLGTLDHDIAAYALGS